MKTSITNSVKRLRLIVPVLFTSWALTTGCVRLISGWGRVRQSPDPLVGWKLDYTHRPSDKVIEKDYQDFIQTLPPDQRGYNVGPVQLYEDGTGQHAVSFEVSVGTYTSWHYAIFYDKENKRVKVIKYGYTIRGS